MINVRALFDNIISYIKPDLDFDSVSKTGLKSLYRFTYFDNDKYYEDILKNILFFPSKSQLNDPFDSQIPTRYDLGNEKALNEYLKTIVTKNVSDSAEIDFLLNTAKQELKNNPLKFQNNIDNLVERKVGILALTENHNNLLLWSHYAHKHTGFCVELDAQYLNNIIINEFKVNRELAFIFKVKYQNKFPIINPFKHTTNEKLQLQFLIKSKDWKYEQEWRIILMNGSQQKREIPPEIIRNIYFGLNAKSENVQKSKAILNKFNPNIGLYKAIKKKNAFGLEFIKLEE
jgi:Protein of unknown function (DUF2971)